ncbi:hypothetical protein P152DRAFT_56994 [Eremomyces bilateralis CBS 781.70]|uniref:Uncharacterized protein n=1 Tax=Eremomyces bilateralis CBS 781.70 TaxID=1392243 RepID=A0A6G1G0K6_9PEZI|nr:uncharacterized protein P152DRAFT_56994 [Eremomyces bilateralis CBS 781.70]KAF1811461.1 hypothetical protein P152DRAFT_56994 [Eremomyces bilateralis CBS 781.70]
MHRSIPVNLIRFFNLPLGKILWGEDEIELDPTDSSRCHPFSILSTPTDFCTQYHRRTCYTKCSQPFSAFPLVLETCLASGFWVLRWRLSRPPRIARMSNELRCCDSRRIMHWRNAHFHSRSSFVRLAIKSPLIGRFRALHFAGRIFKASMVIVRCSEEIQSLSLADPGFVSSLSMLLYSFYGVHPRWIL